MIVNKNARGLFAVTIAVLTLLFSPVAFSGCDTEGSAEKFGISDRWSVKDESYLGRAQFSSSCDDLAVCYGTDRSSKTMCDRAFERSLEAECADNFDVNSEEIQDCYKITTSAVEFARERGGVEFRKGQRRASAITREKDRLERVEARKKEALKRRKRRLQAH